MPLKRISAAIQHESKNNSNRQDTDDGDKDEITERVRFFVEDIVPASPEEAAKAFYEKFHFRNRTLGTDALRKTLRRMSTGANGAKVQHIKDKLSDKNFKKWERGFFAQQAAPEDSRAAKKARVEASILGLEASTRLLKSSVERTVKGVEVYNSAAEIATTEVESSTTVRWGKSPSNSTPTPAAKPHPVSSSSPTDDELEFDRHRLRERYMDMADEKKWMLPSGKYAEDAFSMHSFVIDLGDKRTRQAFRGEDWRAIEERALLLSDQPMHHLVEEYLDTFDLSDSESKLENLRTATYYDPLQDADASDLGDAATYEEIVFEVELVRKLMWEWWLLYQKSANPFITGTSLSEAWWATHAFPTLGCLVDDVDNCFAINGEKSGIESSRRKNRHRPEEPVKATRKKVGTKADIFIRTLGHTPRDWSVTESGHLWDTFGNKAIGESREKLSRQLMDILRHRAQECRWNKRFLEGAKVLGFVTGGSKITRMDIMFGGGHYAMILKGHGLYSLGENLDQFKLNLRVAKFLLKSRGAVIQLMRLFNRSLRQKEEGVDDDDEDQDYFNDLIASSESSDN
ncbi:hypothetical protein BGZ54_005219 [Gamsiella multidivaricata]|nr:hypothetical protein BGZ54_005219 [Gamsiella multidivaricata]